MAKDPADRYPTCRELIQACRGALGVSGEFPPPGGRRRCLCCDGGSSSSAPASPRSPSRERSPPCSSHEAAARTPAPPLAPPNALARIDAETNEVTHVVSDLPVTHALAAGEGAVWVLSSEGSVVLRVDPETFAVDSQGVPGGPVRSPPVWGGLGHYDLRRCRLPALARPETTRQRVSRRIPALSTPTRGGSSWRGSSVWVLAYNSLRTRHRALLRFPPTPRARGRIHRAAWPRSPCRDSPRRAPWGTGSSPTRKTSGSSPRSQDHPAP